MSTFNSVSEALELYVSPFDDEPQAWADVLHRAEVEGRLSPAPTREPQAAGRGRRFRWSRRRLIVAATAAIVIALVATPAFGIGGLLLDLIGRTNVPFKQGKAAPYEIKRDFFDLSHFAPPGMAPQAIVAETRKVGVFQIRGRTRVLYVAPTKKGGYCWMFTDAFGGCRATRESPLMHGVQPGAIKPYLLGVTWQGSGFRFDAQGRPIGKPEHTTQVGGDLLATNAHTLQVAYEDGSKTPIPFIFVSKPIAAGFFLYAIPSGHDRPGTRVRAVSLLDVDGRVLARQPIVYSRPRRLPHPPPAILPPPVRRSPKLPPPAPPLQTGEAKGVTVTAGRNGVAVFDTRNATRDVRGLIAGRAPGYSCFSFMRYHRVAPAANGFTYTTRPRVAIRTFGIRRPFDGCEIQAGYGHRWPDKLDSHSAVEVPFTDAGRRFFTDRAAARDLALFLWRTPGIRQIRRESTATFVQWLRGRFSPRVVELRSPAASPAPGRIGYRVTDSGVLFRRVSPAGRGFTVVVGEKGGIASENVKPLAFVF
jgi:hypothetical protein